MAGDDIDRRIAAAHMRRAMNRQLQQEEIGKLAGVDLHFRAVGDEIHRIAGLLHRVVNGVEALARAVANVEKVGAEDAADGIARLIDGAGVDQTVMLKRLFLRIEHRWFPRDEPKSNHICRIWTSACANWIADCQIRFMISLNIK